MHLFIAPAVDVQRMAILMNAMISLIGVSMSVNIQKTLRNSGKDLIQIKLNKVEIKNHETFTC